jgi:pimeloyl-ACP methyl ester carboxylesterase
MVALRSPGPRGPARNASARRSRTVRFTTVTSADGTRIEAWTNTAEGPTVLLCNGLGSNPYAWPELLSEDCGLRVVSWNHRGVGRSARPADPARVGVDAFVEDAVAVLDGLGVERCVVAGWSIGVSSAFELALRHPERVSGLFAVAGVPGGTFTAMGAPLLLPRPLRTPLSTGAARAVRLVGPVVTPVARRVPMGPVTTTALRFSGIVWPTASYADVRRVTREFLTTPIEWYMHLALAAADHPPVPLSRIGVPTAFVAGRYDVLASSKDIRAAAARTEGATYVELWGTHYLPLERSAEVTALLRDLVARAEAA